MSFKFHRSSSLPSTEKADQSAPSVYAPIKRKLPKWQWYLLALIIFSPLFYLLSKWMISLLFVTASGHIISDSIDIRAPYDSYVSDVSVRLANNVKQGDPLITLNSPALNAQIASLQTNVAQLKMHQSTYNNQSLPALQRSEVIAKKHVANTSDYYQKIQHHYKKGLTTVMELSNAENNYNVAENNLKQIQAQIMEDQENFYITSQENYDQIMAPADQQLVALEAIRKGFQIKADQAGIITELNIHKFEFVNQGMSLMKLSTNQNWHVTAFFEGKDVANIHPGKKVTLLLPDFMLLSGHIINQPSSAQSETQSIVVLQNPENKLVSYIAFDKPLPKNYQVNGMHVTVIIF